jgi:hypothetical protein
VGISALLALLITVVGRLPLLTPDCRAARWAAVPLTAVAADADCEYLSAIRVATQFQPESRIPVRISTGHLGIMPTARKESEVASEADGLDDRTDDSRLRRG